MIHESDLVVPSDEQVARALFGTVDTVYIVVRGPYEHYQEAKYTKDIRVCVDIMAGGIIHKAIPASWLLRLKQKRTSTS